MRTMAHSTRDRQDLDRQDLDRQGLDRLGSDRQGPGGGPGPAPDQGAEPAPPPARRRAWLAAGAAVALLAAGAGGWALTRPSGGDRVRVTSRSTPTTPTTVTAFPGVAVTEPPATVTTAPPATVTTATTAVAAADPVAVWPPAGHRQYTDPVLAVRSFVTEYAGSDVAPLSPFRAGPGSSGEVDVHLVGEGGEVLEDRVVATVEVARAGEVWVVTGARSDDIVVTAPRPLDVVGTRVVVEGRSRGYEGTIVATVRDGGQGAARWLGQAVGIAGSYDLMPFRLEVVVTTAPSAAAGSVLLSTDTGCSGCNTAFAVVPVRFGRP